MHSALNSPLACENGAGFGKDGQEKVAHPLQFQICDSREIHVSACNVRADGLQGFVTRIMQELSLSMGKNVDFCMNSNAIIGNWEDVFKAEKCYTTVLGIKSRTYRCFSFTHEPEHQLCYLILEEDNLRSVGYLPDFKFKAMVLCWYDSKREVCKVEVQYDQLGFYMHCLGLFAAHQWLSRRVLTPVIVMSAKAYLASGLVGPLSFLLHVVFFTVCFLRIFVTSNVGQCCFSCSTS
ncbi:hypothetical protein T492DRAFT_958548 [Pavlovales sp. CCMP2436]|nr:hypothetical protein T492DRAFT_958548 [Pavlovales sp. CCMP2436]|mmetsp:Transcript_37257/g.92739  ORF Transcript_37257/g.92739 Transcript_37257/m.92739 type:complete len:236 (+) Transcript_37257:87-794(+)